MVKDLSELKTLLILVIGLLNSSLHEFRGDDKHF